MTDLTIQQLRVVLAVARCGSFTAASRQLHVVQSSLSRSVAEVERRTGVSLFERTTRRVLLTPEGREFVSVAGGVVDSFDAGMNHFAGFLRGQSGSVTVATLPSLAATILPSIVAEFRRDHAHVEIRIEDALLGQVLERVRGGHADFAVTVESERLEGLSFMPVVADEFCCVFPSGHDFQGATELSWRDLRDRPFIAFDQTSSVRMYADRAFVSAGVRPGPVTEARNVAAVAGLVAAGLGVSAVPSLVLPLLEFARLEHRPLRDPTLTRSVGVALAPARPLSVAARDFLKTIAAAPDTGLVLPDGAFWVKGLEQ